MLDGMYVTKSISTGLYPNLDLWTANKLQLQLQQFSTRTELLAIVQYMHWINLEFMYLVTTVSVQKQ